MPPRKRPKKGAAPAYPLNVAHDGPEPATGDVDGNRKGLDAASITDSHDGARDRINSEDPVIPPLDEDEVLDDLEDTVENTKSHRDYVTKGGYNALKSFNGQLYSGMAIGGSHTWNYDQGVWKETKMEPDLWKINFETKKRRAKNAPRGSGAPVGTEYHWLIVAHQHVKKIDANTYETRLTGSKYKLTHKLASSGSWSIPTIKGQREREVSLLEDAKRRVEGLPPVLASEKVRVEKVERGQQTLDALFAKARNTTGSEAEAGRKRKRETPNSDK